MSQSHQQGICTHRILKEFAPNGMVPVDEEIATRIAGIVERPDEIACGVGGCVLAGVDMMAVMKPNDEGDERLAVIVESALKDCGFGKDATRIVTDRMEFGEIAGESWS
jgi:hypothetical protein